MNYTELLQELDYEYDSNLRLSRIYFNKWIDEGEQSHKEKELMYLGAAHAIMRVKHIIAVI
jgi:hypothetical protein